MTTRLFVLSVCLLATSLGLRAVTKAEIVPVRQSFSTFPIELDGWNGQRAAEFDEKTLSILGVDEYLTRFYYRPVSASLHLYVGYYESQRQGDTIHSPMNCLPGAGWEPAQKGRMKVSVRENLQSSNVRPIEINRVVIQKGVERRLVLYWYQGHGRVLASEYSGKIFMVLDAIRTNRTDAALVRVIAPIAGGESEEVAEQSAVQFVQALFPRLADYLPS
jgi:EpsI family protein